MGCDEFFISQDIVQFQFLLTHPVWDVTVKGVLLDNGKEISTHTSRVGCDLFRGVQMNVVLSFLLTHPVWDVTKMFWR